MLRERGDIEAAEQLRTGALEDSIAEFRAVPETAETLEEKLAAIFAVEEQRVADAAVLAELLAPLLRESRRSSEVGVEAPAAAAMPLPASRFPSAAAEVRNAPANIADFIDEMIAQERSAPRESPSSRAS